MKPVYILIRDTLKSDIQNQKYPVGSLIPSERELAETYQVTRATVQKAIAHMEQEGLVKKVVGKGTYVIALLRHRFICSTQTAKAAR